MNPIAMLFGLALLAVSVFFVASPFRSPGMQKKTAGRGKPLQETVKVSPDNRRQTVLLALRDLDFDYQAGKVAEDDYQALRANLLAEAAQLMESQERQKEDSIEALIQSRRQARAAQPRLQEQPATNVCPHCQAPLVEGAKFCSKCGSPVEETVCPKCKQALQPGDHFCPACGTAVPVEKQPNEISAMPEGK